MANLTFLPIEAVVDPSFWHKLSQVKLDVDRLSETPKNITGYSLDPTALSLIVDYTSFNDVEKLEGKIGSSEHTTLKNLCAPGSTHRIPLGITPGVLINFNISDCFKNINKNQLLEDQGAKIRDAIITGAAVDDPTLLNRFLVITYSDLKTYFFIYWFAFPVLAQYTFPVVGTPTLLSDAFSEAQIQTLLATHSSLEWPNREMFCVVETSGSLECHSLRYYIDNLDKGLEKKLYLCAIDGSTEDFVAAWTCRNLLALVAHYRKSTTSPIRLICLRLGSRYFRTSFVVDLNVEGNGEQLKVVGWSKNENDKFGPRSVNLRDTMDPIRLADASVDLNLKLMKWRLVPELDLDIVKNHKVLLIGAGTLGCSVARCLMGWGVRHITFIDDGYVSLSNPVRQSLYTFEDCDANEGGGKLKADAASSALLRILPTITSVGISMTVPMPGHTTEGLSQACKLHTLISEHDTVFLLTDSRESRWLPTVIAASMNKLAITAALGYDTYLVMRHGVRNEEGQKLGCYFCNDITAPGNSKTDRTLDQQCTVTRPGVSNMAAALAVELLISILQHPQSGSCKADEETVLGTVPHSVRGFLFSFSQVLPSTPSFDQCIACSPKVLDQYENNHDDFLNSVFKSAKYLEDLTGLTQLHKASEMADVLELSDSESVEEMD
uniref:Ubiquitin-like modifier-activating enzyme ATG7 n=2 Tax=Lygus hesperus TaxID=30085 RepID=A0A0A9YG02_LYGHE